MRTARIAVGAALALGLVGCDLAISKHPLGSPLAIEESEWEGTWLHGDGALTVRVLDAENGLLEVAWIEEEEELVLETVEVHLGGFEDWTFASFAGVEDVSGFLWSRLGREGDEVILWWPRAEALARLVEAGLLPGAVEEGDVTLERLEAEHLAILVSEDRGVLYDWDAPMVFRRLR